MHTAHPGEDKAQDLATDDGEVSRKQACEITTDWNGIAREVCDECCECLQSTCQLLQPLKKGVG